MQGSARRTASLNAWCVVRMTLNESGSGMPTLLTTEVTHTSPVVPALRSSSG